MTDRSFQERIFERPKAWLWLAILKPSFMKRLAAGGRRRPFCVAALVLALFFGLSQTPLVSAGVRLAVGLTSFDAFPLDSAVRLTWSTATEINTAAFVVKRAEGGGGFTLLDSLGSGGYIIAKGSAVLGADYEEIDDTAVNGITYTYKLFEVETNTSEVELASLTVTAGLPTPTPSPTPLLISGGQTPAPPADPPPSTLAVATPSSSGLPGQLASSASPSPAVSRPAAESTDSINETGSVSNQPPTPVPVEPSEATVGLTGVVASDTRPDPSSVTGVPESTNGSLTTLRGERAPASQEGYPGPDVTSSSSAEDAYPGGSGETNLSANSTPYPAGTPTNGDGDMTIIGSDRDREDPETETAGPTDSRRVLVGRIYLWVGFVLALLVFGGSVVGSILLFTRKRE